MLRTHPNNPPDRRQQAAAASTDQQWLASGVGRRARAPITFTTMPSSHYRGKHVRADKGVWVLLIKQIPACAHLHLTDVSSRHARTPPPRPRAGVSWHSGGKWCVSAWDGTRQRYYGLFDDEEEVRFGGGGGGVALFRVLLFGGLFARLLGLWVCWLVACEAGW